MCISLGGGSEPPPYNDYRHLVGASIARPLVGHPAAVTDGQWPPLRLDPSFRGSEATNRAFPFGEGGTAIAVTDEVNNLTRRCAPPSHLRAKSRLRRLRSETRLRAQQRGGHKWPFAVETGVPDGPSAKRHLGALRAAPRSMQKKAAGDSQRPTISHYRCGRFVNRPYDMIPGPGGAFVLIKLTACAAPFAAQGRSAAPARRRSARSPAGARRRWQAVPSAWAPS